MIMTDSDFTVALCVRVLQKSTDGPKNVCKICYFIAYFNIITTGTLHCIVSYRILLSIKQWRNGKI